MTLPNTDHKERKDFGTNYGDVALNLPPDWSRSRMIGDTSFMLTAIGHDFGIPDVYKTDDPKARHQFRWIAPDDRNQVSVARTRHYKYVTSAEWTKNPDLWEFDGEGFLVHNGQRLFAREEAYFLQDKAEQQRLDDEKRGKRRAESREEEGRMREIEKRGGIIYDERGRPLTPLSDK